MYFSHEKDNKQRKRIFQNHIPYRTGYFGCQHFWKTLLFPWFAKGNKNVRQTKFQGLEYYYNLHKNLVLAFLFASNSNLVFRIVSPKNVSLKVKRSRYVKLWQLRCFSRRDGHKQQLFRGTTVGWEKCGLQDIGLFLSKLWPTNWKSHDPCPNFS